MSVNAGQAGSVQVSLAGMNGFNGAVNLSCSGLPTGVSCSFTPATVTLSGTDPTTVMVSIATATPTPTNPYSASLGGHGMVLAGMLPLGLLGLAGFRKRLMKTRGALLMLACVLTIGGLAGCGGMKSTAPGSTTSGTANSGDVAGHDQCDIGCADALGRGDADRQLTHRTQRAPRDSNQSSRRAIFYGSHNFGCGFQLLCVAL